MIDWKQWDWKHTLYTVCGLGTAISIYEAAQVQAGAVLPWHITTGTLGLLTLIFGYISHSLTGSTGAKDMLGQAAPGAQPEVKAAVARNADTPPSRPPPPFPKALLVLVLALGSMRALTACKDTALPSDLVTDYQCVQDGISAKLSALQIEAKCLPGQLQTALNIIEGLLLSPQWRAANPDKIEIAEGVRSEALSLMAKGAK